MEIQNPVFTLLFQVLAFTSLCMKNFWFMYMEICKIRCHPNICKTKSTWPNPYRAVFLWTVIPCWNSGDKQWARAVAVLWPCFCSGGWGLGTGMAAGRRWHQTVSGGGSPLALLVGSKVPSGSDESKTLLGASQECNGRSGLQCLLSKIPEERRISSCHSCPVSAPWIPLAAPRKDSPFDLKCWDNRHFTFKHKTTFLTIYLQLSHCFH